MSCAGSLFLPVKRFSLSSERSSVPLPTLSDRQFVVSKEQLTQEEERLQRELFWYREELFKIVDATWTEVRFFPWASSLCVLI